MTYLQTQAQAAYKSAEETYTQAIGTQLCFGQLLDGIPVDDVELYDQVRAWEEEAIACVNAAWKARQSASAALAAVQGK